MTGLLLFVHAQLFYCVGWTGSAVNDLVVNRAKLWLDAGHIFGKHAWPFQRVVLACPRATLAQALEQLRQAAEAI